MIARCCGFESHLEWLMLNQPADPRKSFFFDFYSSDSDDRTDNVDIVN